MPLRTYICTLTLMLVPTMCFSVSIINRAKSLASRVTSTFQRNVLPDVVVRIEDENQATVLRNAERHLNQFAHTAASDLKEVAHELNNIADNKIDATSQRLDNALSQIDTILHNRTDHAAQELTQIIHQLESIIHHFETNLDYTIDDINNKFYRIVDRVMEETQQSVGNAIRQTGYTISGSGATLIGLYILKQALCDTEQSDSWVTTIQPYLSSVTCMCIGLLLMENSEELAQHGLLGYISTHSQGEQDNETSIR